MTGGLSTRLTGGQNLSGQQREEREIRKVGIYGGGDEKLNK